MMVTRSWTPAFSKFACAISARSVVDFVRVEVAAGSAQGEGQPQARLARGRADLDDMLGTHRLGQDAQHRPSVFDTFR